MDNAQLNRSITWQQGTALAIAAVIGCGILVLPALTAQKAGPASLLAWIIMSLLTFPIVITLGKLAQYIPKAGGIVSYASSAFGSRVGVITSWVLLGSIPIGAPVVALTGAYYLSFIVSLTRWQITIIAAIMLLVSVMLNIRGIELSSKVSITIVCTIIILLLITVVSTLPQVKQASFYPFVPNGFNSIGSASVIIFFAFAGWEMITPLAEEFKNPSRDIKLSLILSAVFICILYTLLSFVTIGTLTYTSSDESTPLSALMTLAFGKPAGYITAVLAILITFGTTHANIAGFSRIIYSQARQGDFPYIFSKLHPTFKTPSVVLKALTVAFSVVLFSYGYFNIDLSTLIKGPSVVFIIAYIIAMVSAIKILKKSDIGWWTALISAVVCSIIYFFSGWACLFPIILGVIGWAFSHFNNVNHCMKRNV